MKKLLLLSLLTLSATSFADIFQGTADHVSVPVKVTGQVIDTSTADLIIETDKTTGVDGGSIVFDFGQIDKSKASTTISRAAKFIVKKGNGSAFDTESENVKVGMLKDKAVAATHETTGDSVKVLGSGGKVVYTVSSDTLGANAIPTGGAKVINGTLKVDVVVGSAPEVGQLLDASQRLVAYLSATE